MLTGNPVLDGRLSLNPFYSTLNGMFKALVCGLYSFKIRL